MIKYSFLIYVLCVGITHANQPTFFMNIPAHMSTAEAYTAVEHAASHRKWTVTEIDKNNVRTELNHRGHFVILEFSFTETEILYVTKSFSSDDEDEFASGPPKNWIANIKKDIKNIFLIIEKIKNRSGDTSIVRNNKATMTSEDAEDKLVSLKNYYNNKLITESEYELKRKDILTRF